MDHLAQARYSISDVTGLTGVAPHTLRSWERALEPLLQPARTPGGQRRYSDSHVRLVRDISRRITKDGQSLAAVRRELLQARYLAQAEDEIGSRLLADPAVQQALDEVAETVKRKLLRLLARGATERADAEGTSA